MHIIQKLGLISAICFCTGVTTAAAGNSTDQYMHQYFEDRSPTAKLIKNYRLAAHIAECGKADILIEQCRHSEFSAAEVQEEYQKVMTRIKVKAALQDIKNAY